MSLALAEHKKEDRDQQVPAIIAALGPKSIVLIGLMGAGKTAVGKRLAAKLDLPFVDADKEIEEAAGNRSRKSSPSTARPISARASGK